jgi:uncharacterized protein
VTGASSGIGEAFAHVLAERGFGLALTARRADRLHALARDLSSRHEVATHVIPADLSDPAAPREVVEELTTRGVHIDMLVNNAGYGVPGAYRSTAWQRQDDVLRVMVVAVAELTHRVLPGMVERKWGRVINVASLAGLMPGVAGHTLYAASKAFVIRFSESLAPEVRRDGVHITAICPGFTLSEFHDVTGTRDQVSQMPRFLWMDAPTVARQGYDAVMRGDVVYINGRVIRAIALAGRLLPRRLIDVVMARNAHKFRKV